MQTLKARWIFPGTSPPISDGRITIDGDRIVRVGADIADSVDLDLGDVAIVPGFVNAHTHLELGPIPWDESAGPEDQIEWLKRVIRSRLDAPAGAGRALAEANIRAAIEAGTTTIADITTAGQSWDAVAASPVWGTVFAEVLGLADFRADQTWGAAIDWLNSLPSSLDPDRPTLPGLSPHAPYSTAGRLYQAAAATGLPLSTHLGELPEEREFLSRQSGPLREFVAGLGAWNDAWRPVGPSPIDYVTTEGDWIIAHGNIFEPAEIARLIYLTAAERLADDQTARRKTGSDPQGEIRTEAPTERVRPRFPHQQMPPEDLTTERKPEVRRLAVAYCPRTHARFGHPPHPFRAMLEAGVVVCLGTDSLASTPTLSILDEVRFLHRHHPDIPGATLLRMATLNGAWALRRDHQTGSLEPGKSADLAVLALGDSPATSDPHDYWLRELTAPLTTMFRGQFLAD